ncbi:MAG TPA: HD domain-containing phosphohydrolase [Candidatus Saccharimonadaceae bacterium]|jgi:signal transduction histidine kinase|nr:HD domain-containing phosphohydrolase [Candidatus Saccharimonadaceae bacterium]
MSVALTRRTPGPDLEPAEGLVMVAQALLALRSTADVGTACAVAGLCAMRALEANDYRLLRLDPRTGAVRTLEESGVESPCLPEPDGPVEHVLRESLSRFDDGHEESLREAGLWLEVPAALATLPLCSAGHAHGVLLLSFSSPRTFSAADRMVAQTLADALALALERDVLRRSALEERQRANQLEQRLNDGEETSSGLMSVVAHEIRSPLTAIKAYTEAMLDNLANPHAPRERFLGIINDECDRLTRLVTDILDLSRLEAGQRPLRLARLNLESLVRETLDGLMPQAKGRQIEFDLDVEKDLLPECDPDLLRRLLVNLVGNAIKYSPPGGTVRIHAQTRGEEWFAFVQDQGPGIPAEDMPHVFERFFRARQGSEHEVEGTGLGLAISRGIAELHGGRIWVQASPPHGSRFCFTMPVRQLATPRARRLARQVWTRVDLRELFDHTVEMVAATMDAEIVSLMLVDPEHGDLFIASSRGLEGQNLLGRRTSVRSGVAGSVAAWGRPLLVNNIETDRRFRRLNHPQYKTKSLLCAPLRVQGEVLGVFNVNNKNAGTAFDEDDLSVLSALIERVAGAVERAIAHPESPRIVSEAVDAVRSVTRLKRDHLLGGHDVVHLARATARELNIPDPDADLIGYVASVHDVGMTRMHERVAGPGALDREQVQALTRHPETSVEIIRPLEYLNQVRDLILSHHERWDGRGYPRGLKGDDIPLGGRVLAVVDAYDSMTRGRAHRAPRPREEAIAELRRAAGAQFDPQAVEALVRVVERESGGAS